MTTTATRDRVIAFRLHGHGLTARAERSALAAASGACGVQNTPPGSAGMALSARVAGVGADDVVEALEQDRSVLQAFSLRGAPHVFPAADAAVFTRGLLPGTEDELRGFMPGAQQPLDRVRMSATDVVDLTAEVAMEVLDGEGLTKEDLGRAVGEEMTARLPRGADSAAWRSASWLARGQFLGESIVRFAFAVVSLKGMLCHGERSGRSPLLRRTDQWLGAPVHSGRSAPAELVRRYLRCYGPSSPQQFAQWAGVTPEQAERTWRSVEGELAEVEVDGARRVLLRADVARLEAAEVPGGVRLLPPHDPYLQARDRETIVPDAAWQRQLWRATGNPGVVVADGEVVAAWRPTRSGRRLDLTVEAPRPLPRRLRGDLRDEAERLARHRGCTLGAVDGLPG